MENKRGELILVYRDFLELTDDDIRFIVNKIFNSDGIGDISRSKKFREITCCVVMTWKVDDENISYEDIEDELIFKENGIQGDFSITKADELEWRKYLMAKGCHFLLRDNPYIEKSN